MCLSIRTSESSPVSLTEACWYLVVQCRGRSDGLQQQQPPWRVPAATNTVIDYPMTSDGHRWKFKWHSYDSKLSISSILYHRKYISLKTRCFGLYFCCRMFTFIFDHFGAIHFESCQVRWRNEKYGPFRHSRSLILVPIKSSYTTSY